MSVEIIKVCKCDICGKVLPKETGHLRWQANVKLGSNIGAGDRTYDDVCDECADTIRETIEKLKVKYITEDQVYANERL